MNNNIAQVVVALPVEGPFDYRVDPALQPLIRSGQRVYVSFRRQRTVGVVVGLKAESAFERLKPVLALLDGEPALDAAALAFLRLFAGHYGCSLGEAVELALPQSLRRKKTLQLSGADASGGPYAGSEAPGLFHGPLEGACRAEMMEQVRAALAGDRGVLFLVPDRYALQDARAFLEREFGETLAVMEKRMPARRERETWVRVREGRALLVLGTRSAVFAPVRRLGLIVISDEDNVFYKEEQSPFYHARETALMRAGLEGARVIWTSPAPSAEAWQAACAAKTLRRFDHGRYAPMGLVDQTNYKSQRRGGISFPLFNHIEEAVRERRKVWLFLNRRGFYTVVRCSECGHTLTCPRCDARLMSGAGQTVLRCCLCDRETPAPERCPHCGKAYLRAAGSGVDKVVSEVQRAFAQVKVARFDRETGRVPDADIVVGTQAALKLAGKVDFALIAVLDADGELNRADFRSAQRFFSLLVRLRRMASSRVLVQSFQPDSYALQAALKMDFDGFYARELALRREMDFPPFNHLTAVTLRGTQQAAVSELAGALFERLSREKPGGMEILEPQPDIRPKLRDKYRFTIIIRGGPAEAVPAFVKPAVRELKKKRGVVVTVNVDP